MNNVIKQFTRVQNMKIAVIGIGYVGTAVAAKFAEIGHEVIGVDIDQNKVDAINSGKNPLLGDEPRLPELIQEVSLSGNLKATSDYSICSEMETIIVAVETPFDTRRKRPLYFSLRKALESLSPYIKKGTLVVIESTLAPKTTDTIIQPILEKGSGFKAGIDFYLSHAPERVMPGVLLHNIENLDRVVGGVSETCRKKAQELYQRLTKGIVETTTNLMAETVKTTENAYRDVQIAFANEVALLATTLELDVYELREFVNKVPGRHIHLPGAGVGGHCIPKDSWLLAYGAQGKFQPRLLIDAREINDFMPHHVADLCEESLDHIGKSLNNAKIVVLGVAFLENSGDIRNSPAASLIEDLEVFNCDLTLHDPYVQQLNGHLVTQDILKAVQNADAIILVTKHKEYYNLDWKAISLAMRPQPVFIDGRNVLKRNKAEEIGFLYQGVGNYRRPSN